MNPNLVNADQARAWVEDYFILCKKHQLYLVLSDEVWLQGAGELQDIEEAANNMEEMLLC